jgi:recombinational DNA repair ATPase RecF
MRTAMGAFPVVLLDDVLSELDPKRRGYVLQRVGAPEPTRQRQLWITTTETDLAPADEFLRDVQRFLIDAGTVRPA